jgi:hypothetical protein
MNKLCRFFGHVWDLRTFGERELWENNLRPEQQRDWKCLSCKITATEYERKQEEPLIFKASKFHYWIKKKCLYYSFKIREFFKYEF